MAIGKHVVGTVDEIPPGEYAYDRLREILRCPWHGWEFEIRTGQSWFDPRKVRVRRYDVRVAPAPVTAAPAEDDAEAISDMERGPYVAETYPVTVERQNVVVDVPGQP